MADARACRFDNLSTMQEALTNVEIIHFSANCPSGLLQARNGLIVPALNYRNNRLEFGRALYQYRTFYKEANGWTEAARVIGDAIGVSERTIYRIVEDYERAQGLAPMVAEELLDQKIDPAAQKNAVIVDQLQQMTTPSTQEDA